jgi:threonine dehydrogenase-like Zn-dependent dehydrogenase
MRLSIISIVAFAATNVNAFTMTPAGIAQRTALSMTAENNEVKEIKVGVIGCGRIGIVHLGAITKAPNVKPIIVSNPTVSKAEAG